MKAKTHTFKGRIYSEVPAEVVKHFRLRPGDVLEFAKQGDTFIIQGPAQAPMPASPPSEPAGPSPAPTAPAARPVRELILSEDEKKALNNIRYIKHAERTLDAISKKLDAAGKKRFDELLQAGVVFRYKKYNKELYGISREYFRQLDAKPAAAAAALPKKPALPADPQLAELSREGFLVMVNENEVRGLNEKLKKSALKAHGIRAFDMKYYIITDARFEDISRRVLESLTRDKKLSELAGELGIKEGLCRAAIELLREEGRVIEKRRELYARV